MLQLYRPFDRLNAYSQPPFLGRAVPFQGTILAPFHSADVRVVPPHVITDLCVCVKPFHVADDLHVPNLLCIADPCTCIVATERGADASNVTTLTTSQFAALLYLLPRVGCNDTSTR